jgi:type I restriction-modification system DNA methylase subunit
MLDGETMTTQDLAYAEIKKLVENFRNLSGPQRKGMNEMQTRLGYILPLFRALGWDINNINEVSPEEKVSRGWVDFSFRIGNVPRFFLETKKVNENLNDPRWVKQAIDYAWTKSVTWALLSDFEGLRVFNAEWKESNPFSAQFVEFDLDSYLSDFERLWWLSRSETVARRLDLEAEKVGKKLKRQPVSQALFDDLKKWRENLFKNYKAFNPIISAAEIDAAVLRLLNRLIFIRTAEDRYVEDIRLRSLVRELKDRKQISRLDRELALLFRQFDETYNSELFARHFSEELLIPPKDLEDVIEGLYEKNYVRYNFNALDADVLGTAYEQYLGHVVAEAAGETHVEAKRTKRKSQGIYYTPTFVTKYIVRQTVGKYLDEHGYNPSRPPRVLDMACGSGSFLIEAFDVIDDFVAKQRGHAQKGEVDFFDRARQLEVLQNSIFGVDKDKQAMEVARLNLLLRALHSRERLPMLENIAHGDSLRPETFEINFPQIMKEGGFDVIIGNPPYVRIQTLDKAEVEFFNQNFEVATGNYDIYVLFVEKALRLLKPGGVMGFILPNKFMQVDYGEGLRKLLSENLYVEQIVDFKSFQVFEGATTYTCLLFLRKKQNLSFSLVVPVSPDEKNVEMFNVPPTKVLASNLTTKAWTLSDDRSAGLLEKFKNVSTVPLLELPSDMSRGSSSGADSIFILTKVGDRRYKTREGLVVEIEPEVLRVPLYATDFGRYDFRPKEKERIIFPYRVKSNRYSLFEEKEFKKNYPKAYSYLSEHKKELEERKDYRLWYAFSAPRNLHLHDIAQIVVPLLADKGLYALLPNNKAHFCLMASGGFSISVLDKEISPTYVLGLLNSKALFWYLKQISNVFRGGWITCTKQYVGQIPIRRIDFENPAETSAHDEIVSLVEKMLALQKERQSLKPEEDLDKVRTLEKQIAVVDAEIDRRVYALYGLTEDEIQIIEGN